MNVIRVGAASIGLGLILTGCGAPARDADAPDAGPATTHKEAPEGKTEASSGRGDCDLFTKEELTAAFGGKLEFGNLSGFRGRGSSCNVSVRGYEGEFILNAESQDAFEARRETYTHYQEQGSATMVPVDVGTEGYLVNNAQVIAIDSEGRAINVALQLFVFDGSLPVTREEVATGVQTIAQQALSRL